MSGTLYGVGVGPGDPELLTLKAVKTIQASQVIALPVKAGDMCMAYQIAKSSIKGIEQIEKIYIPMPMTREKKVLEEAHQQGADRICRLLDQGKKIAFLTLGDPTVYSTYLYIHKRVAAAGYKTEIVSGIPSFCAAAAKLGIGLAENSEQLHIIPASYQIEEAMELSGTKVFMKTGKRMKLLKEQLAKKGLDSMMVENCGMESEKIYIGTNTLEETAGYFSLVIAKEK